MELIVCGMALKLTRSFDAQNMVYINGFDRPEIIAGAGTMGIEILNQVPDVDAIIVPVGGCGLIAGLSLAVKTLAPDVQVIVSCDEGIGY